MAPTGWPPPAAGLQPIRAIGSPPGGHSVSFVCVDAPPHCWSFSTDSSLRVPVCAYLGRLCTQRVCWLRTNPPRACDAHTSADSRERERKRTRKKGERRKKKPEKETMCICAPLASSPGPKEIDLRTNGGDISRRGSKAPKVPISTGVLWEFRLKVEIRKRGLVGRRRVIVHRCATDCDSY